VPRIEQLPTTQRPAIDFVASPTLDMLNAMYFTSLAGELEGIEGWPVQLRREMAPDLLAELDALYNYPAGDPGIMGILGDRLVVVPETWGDIDAFVRYVRSLPDGYGAAGGRPGIQELIFETTFKYLDAAERAAYEGIEPREAIEKRMQSLDDRDAEAIMALYGRPAELRERMARLIERFYAEHYKDEMPERLPALERNVAALRSERVTDPAALARRLTGRSQSCLEGPCAGDWERLVFAPSPDMGPYVSCTIAGNVHGLFYPVRLDSNGGAAVEEEIARMARVYKALADEQRLRILRMLSEREMYAQEIVERTGLHQSVVSRHLSFMKAVGLLTARRRNNMKFFSINPGMKDELAKTLDVFAARPERAQA
jgi:DNA-binding transcriptional ArsR family regulator